MLYKTPDRGKETTEVTVIRPGFRGGTLRADSLSSCTACSALHFEVVSECTVLAKFGSVIYQPAIDVQVQCIQYIAILVLCVYGLGKNRAYVS